MRYGGDRMSLASSPLTLASGVAPRATRSLAVAVLRSPSLLAPARVRACVRAVPLSPVAAPADPGDHPAPFAVEGSVVVQRRDPGPEAGMALWRRAY